MGNSESENNSFVDYFLIPIPFTDQWLKTAEEPE